MYRKHNDTGAITGKVEPLTNCFPAITQQQSSSQSVTVVF